MPLSEDEKRILTEIEQQLYASDPQLARQVSSTTVYSDPLRQTRFAVAGIVVGLVLTVALLQVHFLLAFVAGFGLMLLSAVRLEGALRHLGRVGVQQVADSLRHSGVRDVFGPRRTEGGAERSDDTDA